jgi:hypothetical protein
MIVVKDCRVETDLREVERLPDSERYQEPRWLWVEFGGPREYGHDDLFVYAVESVNRSIETGTGSAVNALPLVLVWSSGGSVSSDACTFRAEANRNPEMDVNFPGGRSRP